MADFTSEFWHWYIAIATVASILACVWLLRWMTAGFQKKDEVETTGHVWDGDLTELNNPLPRWWLGLFYITLAFGGFYLLLYPGLGSFEGFLKWTSKGQYEREVTLMEAEVGPLFGRLIGRWLDDLILEVVPDVRKAVRWNSPFYGLEGRGWFVSFHCFTRYVKVTFHRSAKLTPVPPVASKHEDVRYLHLHEGEERDRELVKEWIRQASELPGEDLF